jgi:hypothetical protein
MTAESEVERLLARMATVRGDPELGGLESDVWRSVELRTRQRRLSAACGGALAVLVLTASFSFGHVQGQLTKRGAAMVEALAGDSGPQV